MFTFWALGFALLIFGFTTACESGVGGDVISRNDCYRRDCNGTQFDTREAVCCENKLHPGESLSCCGKQSYNPGTATCCKIQHEHTLTASVTQGLSEEVSECCELKAYNPVNEICCRSRIVTKPAPMVGCCGKEVFDMDNQLCCGPTHNKSILMRNTSHHQCCGHNQYDPKTQCCCSKDGNTLEIQPKVSDCCVKDSNLSAVHLCGNKTYDKHKELCCQSAVVRLQMLLTNYRCCDQRVYDTESQLCCGPMNDKKILTKNSKDHQCCHHDQFNTKTQCCCWKNDTPEIQSKNSSCCVEESALSEGVQQLTFDSQPNCTEPKTNLCGSTCYNPNEDRCCERNQTKPHWICSSGQREATPSVYDPRTHVCCNGCLSVREPWVDQCCGEAPYGLGQRGVLCCNNTLYKDREDGEECSETGIPYNPAKGTICCSQFHGNPGQHCCGTEIYQPHAEICCTGHRYLNSENIHCCGIKAYNFKDQQMKCCAGTLYNLTSLDKHGGDAECCGSSLQKPQDVCCSSEDKEVLYSAKRGFRCCGHVYYNTTLWLCCAGRLTSIHEPRQAQRMMVNGSRLLSVNNLNRTDLCELMHVGTVESVSLHSIVFRNVLKVHGKNATVKALPLPHILETDDHCSSPKLIPGETYFFNEVNIFIDFNHDFVLQSLHFIISKCFP